MGATYINITQRFDYVLRMHQSYPGCYSVRGSAVPCDTSKFDGVTMPIDYVI